jgi:hypothetical protein
MNLEEWKGVKKRIIGGFFKLKLLSCSSCQKWNLLSNKRAQRRKYKK